MAIILGSQSPRRRQLMETMGLQFRVQAADIDETVLPGEPPEQAVCRICRAKADAIAATADGDDIIVTADTIVVLDGAILGKPHDTAQARQMLTALSGRTHTVITALCIRRGQDEAPYVYPSRTDVTFRPLSAGEIDAYLRTGEPMDKAGAYGIQGIGSMLVQQIHGDYFTVMGLPVAHLAVHLRDYGVPVLGQTAQPN